MANDPRQMSVAELVARARQRLLAGGVPADEAPGDAEVLARQALGWDLTTYAIDRRELPPADFAERYDTLITRRLTREPVSHIVGSREFWGLDFEVSRDVLTPRPETELVVQAALDIGREPPASASAMHTWPSVIIDIGTGSGCLAVVLAKEFPEATVIASDVSLAAISVARRNAARHGVSQRVAFMHGGWIPPENDVEMIVSNPPYIPLRDAASLAPEVRDHEPSVALFGGQDGLDFYRRLLNDCIGHLNPDGWLIVEVGYDQAAAVRALADPYYWVAGRTYRDLQAIERVLTFRALRRYRGEGLDDELDNV
jgi:release factor glutamine methyltransferase